MSGLPEKDWCDAMKSEDGGRLLHHLSHNPQLVSLKYRGCTALHLALRNNWYGLVHAILRKFDHLRTSPLPGAFSPPSDDTKFFDLDVFRDILTAKEGDRENLSKTDRIWQGRKRLQADKTRWFASGLDIFAMAVIQGNMAINVILAEAVCAIDNLFDDDHSYKRVIRVNGGKPVTSIPNVLPKYPTGETSKQRSYIEDLTCLMSSIFNIDVQTIFAVRDDAPVSSAAGAMKSDSFVEDTVENQKDVEDYVERASEATTVTPSSSCAEEIDSQTPLGSCPWNSEVQTICVVTDDAPVSSAAGAVKSDSFVEHTVENQKDVEDHLERASEATTVAPSSSCAEGITSQTPLGSSRCNSEEDRLGERLLDEWQLTSPFLLFHEFLFLLCCQGRIDDYEYKLTQIQSDVPLEIEFLKYLQGINDTRGTAIHYASLFNVVVPVILANTKVTDFSDSLGRTPLHIACAVGDSFRTNRMIKLLGADIDAVWDVRKSGLWELPDDDWGELGGCAWEVDVKTVSEVNGYWPLETKDDIVDVRPLELAMYSPFTNEKFAREIIKDVMNGRKTDSLDNSFRCPNHLSNSESNFKIVGILQLAAYMGNVEVVQELANDDNVYDTARLNNKSRRANKSDPHDHKYSALHVAAIAGHPHIIRIILASGKFDPVVKDLEGNTALHLATHFQFHKFAHTLTDFVKIPDRRIGISYKSSEDLSAQERREMTKAGESKRQGCINLLLQAGIDIWEMNMSKQIADPGPEASPEYSTWWYDKISKETQEAKTSLNAAANAISVTAALVATASYVGPLQPPLGYDADNESLIEKMQVRILSVRMFIVCDTLAFYLALGAIMLSLTPSLPMPQESILDELKLIRRSVTLALTLLIFAIVGILLAFASASLAVIPDEGSWNHGGLTVSTVAAGGTICVVVLLLCFFRAVRLFCHKSSWIRNSYKKCVYI